MKLRVRLKLTQAKKSLTDCKCRRVKVEGSRRKNIFLRFVEEVNEVIRIRLKLTQAKKSLTDCK